MFGQSRVIRHGRIYQGSYTAEVDCRLAYSFDAIDTLIANAPLAAIFQRPFCPHCNLFYLYLVYLVAVIYLN